MIFCSVSSLKIGNMSPQSSNRSFKAAQIIVSTIPILCVYPFLQKYFVKGIILGAIKE